MRKIVLLALLPAALSAQSEPRIRQAVNRAPEVETVLEMIDRFYDPLIEGGVAAPVTERAVLLSEAA